MLESNTLKHYMPNNNIIIKSIFILLLLFTSTIEKKAQNEKNNISGTIKDVNKPSSKIESDILTQKDLSDFKTDYKKQLSEPLEFEYYIFKDSVSIEIYMEVASHNGVEIEILPQEFREKNKDLFDKIAKMNLKSYTSCPICKKSFRQKLHIELHILRNHLDLKELIKDYNQKFTWFGFIKEYLKSIKLNQENPELSDKICLNFLENLYFFEK